MAETLDDLYGAPLADFVGRRDELARALRKDGKREEAEAVKALRKPTVAAWAINRVAREHAAEVERLLRAGDVVRAAQERALGGDRSELRDTVEERRTVIRRLTDQAVELSSDTHRQEIDATLEAASIDADVGDLLRRGRLTTTVPRPSGFDVLAGMEFAGPAPSSTDDGDRRAAEKHAVRERLERRLSEADDAVERSRSRLLEAENALADAQREVDEARTEAERDVRVRDEIRAELSEE